MTTLFDYGDREPCTYRWAPPRARRSDPDTSREAAEAVAPRAGTHRALALEVLRAHPEGLTDWELSALCGGIPQTSIGVRRGELVRRGLVEATERRGRTPSGSSCIVWRAV